MYVEGTRVEWHVLFASIRVQCIRAHLIIPVLLFFSCPGRFFNCARHTHPVAAMRAIYLGGRRERMVSEHRSPRQRPQGGGHSLRGDGGLRGRRRRAARAEPYAGLRQGGLRLAGADSGEMCRPGRGWRVHHALWAPGRWQLRENGPQRHRM